jgi:hypothetical protein
LTIYWCCIAINIKAYERGATPSFKRPFEGVYAGGVREKINRSGIIETQKITARSASINKRGAHIITRPGIEKIIVNRKSGGSRIG